MISLYEETPPNHYALSHCLYSNVVLNLFQCLGSAGGREMRLQLKNTTHVVPSIEV